MEDHLSECKITLQIDEEAKNYLSARSYLAIYGAHPPNRVIQMEFLDLLSVMLIDDCVREGEVVCISFDGPCNRLHNPI